MPELKNIKTWTDRLGSMTPLTRLTPVPAVKNRRLHQLDGDLLLRPGPRVVEGVTALAALLAAPPPDGGAK